MATTSATNANDALPGAPSIKTTSPEGSVPDAPGNPTLVEHALAYARRGWHVFPVGGDKRPHRMLGTSGGYYHATVDADRIAAWWASDATANIGIAVAPSGLVVLDVDVTEGKPGVASLRVIADKLPADTREVLTGSGGTHLYYSRPDGVQPARKIGIRPGLDLIGDGYIIAPPSVHACGGTYEWVDEDAAIAELPQILIDAMGAPRVSSTAPTVATSTDDAIPSGSRNDALTRIAGSLRRVGQSVEEIEAALLVRNLKCDPPLDESEVRAIARSVGRYAPTLDPSTAGDLSAALDAAAAPEPGSWEAELARADADVVALLGVGGSRKRRDKPMGVRGDELMRRTIAGPTWLVHGLITDGGTAMIATSPKVGKTWIATEIAMAVANGTLACGEFACRKARTMYVYLEDTERSVQSRLRALAVGRGLDPEDATRDMLVVPRGEVIDLLDDQQLGEIVASARTHGPIDLLVIDPLRDAHSGEEDKSDSMSQVMRRIRVLGKLLSCTVLVVHHAVKARGEPSGRHMRGSGAIHGSVDSGLYLDDGAGNQVTEFRNSCVSQLKSARSAGEFVVTLNLVDGPDGTAIKASWQVTRAGASPTGATAADALARAGAADQALLGAIQKEHEGCRWWTASKWWRTAELKDLHGLPSRRAMDDAMARLGLRGQVRETSMPPGARKQTKHPVMVPVAA